MSQGPPMLPNHLGHHDPRERLVETIKALERGEYVSANKSPPASDQASVTARGVSTLHWTEYQWIVA